MNTLFLHFIHYRLYYFYHVVLFLSSQIVKSARKKIFCFYD